MFWKLFRADRTASEGSVARTASELVPEAQKSVQCILERNRDRFEEISGSVLQYSAAAQRRWVRSLERLGKDALIESGLCAAVEAECLGARHAKLLVSRPGSRGQLPHRDGLDARCFVVAFYLPSPQATGSSATEPTRFSSLDPPSNYLDFSEEQARNLDEKEWDVSAWPEEQWARAGDFAVFREDVVHAGPPHPSGAQGERCVFFLSLVPRHLPQSEHTDKVQLFKFNWLADGYGSDHPIVQRCIAEYEAQGHDPKSHLYSD